MSTAHPPTAQAPMRTVLSHVIVPILMGLIMCAAYLGGFHKPSPHHVPVAVVGQAQQAGPLAAKVQDAFGDEADVRTIATPEQATDQLKHLKISAAYVPGDGKAELLTAGGASDTTKSFVEKMFRPVAEKQHDALTVKDVAPLTEDDPAGQRPDTPHYRHPTGGWGSVGSVLRHLGGKRVPLGVLDTLWRQNKPRGHMCTSCAWAKPASPHLAEFC